jgi:pyruvate kinase
MIENPMPTRAEITDVANAVYEQADAIMLSGETTVGKYPLKCVEVFHRIAQRIEKSGGANFQHSAELTTSRQKLVKSAVVMANEVRAPGLLVFTVHGTMARYAAWMRPHHSEIFAVCPNEEVAASMALNWGIYPVVLPFTHRESEPLIGEALRKLVESKRLNRGDGVVIVSSIAAGEGHADAIQMRTVD